MQVVLHIVEHSDDALAILLMSLFVDVGRQLDVFRIFASLQVMDGWHLLARNILDDMLVSQRLEYFVERNRT